MKKFFVVFAVLTAAFTFVACNKIGGLQWSERTAERMTWNEAINYCNNLKEGGKNDWRLPTISELKTTIKNCHSGGSACKVSDSCLTDSCWVESSSCTCAYRKNNSGYYSKLGDDDKVILWSSSVVSDFNGWYWGVNFGSGLVYYGSKDVDANVRCVR